MFQVSKNNYFRIVSRSGLFFLFLLSAFQVLWGQVGLPEIDNYPPAAFSANGLVAGPQVYQVARDHKGRLVMANREGVLVYNGSQYLKVAATRPMEISKIVADVTGKIFLGGKNDLGYLEDDSLGKASFHSLGEGVPDSLKDQFRIYQIVDFKGSIFFMASDFVAVWQNTQLLTIPARTKNYRLMPTADALFLYDRREGLLRWNNKGFEKVAGGNSWGGILPKGMVRRTEKKEGSPSWLVFSRKNGIYQFSKGILEPFSCGANGVLQGTTSYNIVELAQGEVAVATFGEGLLILDASGKVLQQINEENGLAVNIVVNVTKDVQGSLWLGLNEGFARVTYPTDLSLFDKRLGVEAAVLDIQEWDGRLFFGTLNGLYVMSLQKGSRQLGRVQKVPEINFGVHALLPVAQPPGLLLATGEGVFWGDGERFSLVEPGIFRSLTKSKLKPEMVYAGGRNRVIMLDVEQGKVADEVACEGKMISSLVQEENGQLWGGGDSIIRFVKGGDGRLAVQVWDSSNNWRPEMEEAGLALVEDNVIFYSWAGASYPSGDYLFPVKKYGGYLEEGNHGLFAQLGKDSLFLAKEGAAGLLCKEDGSWHWDTLPFAGLPPTSIRVVRKIGKSVWLGTDVGAFRYTLPGKPLEKRPFQVVLEKASAGEELLLRLDEREILLPAEANSLQFGYTATEFERIEAIAYRHRLRGYREAWSPWTERKFAEYTNLPGGDYVFEVQGRNGFGAESEVANFAFHLATPWFRQWWAYGLYLLMGLLFIGAVVRLRTRQLVRAKARLEGIVEERTREIAAQNEQIRAEKKETEKQRDRAEESERVKKRFFANMTHELRTPLTLILGPLAQLKSDPRHAVGEPKFSLIERNGKRLLRLINQLLDISRIESDRMELRPVRRDVVAAVKQAMSNFEAMAAGKGVDLRLESAMEYLEMDFDPEKLEKILFNLLSNAVKFTAQGNIQVALTEGGELLKMEVRDTGKGIAAANQAYVFDRFYQSGTGDGKAGTGIGMALTKELVELHGGQISLESELGIGSTFKLSLPLVQAELEKGEVELSEQADLYVVDDPHVSPARSSMSEAEATAEDARNVVLVVEDNADVRSYIVSCIPPDYRVMEAEDGEKGLEMANRWVPDLVISDVMMPGLDGFELTSALKSTEATSHVPVILLTSRAEAESRMKGLETGADAYLTKPFNPDELQVRMRNLIAVRATLREKFHGKVLLEPAKVEATSTEEAFLIKVKSLIETRFGDDKLQVEDMAQAVSLSKVQFSRKFKALTGTTPNKFLRTYRLDIARQLIVQKAGSMAEIGFQVGFSSAAYFSKCFMDAYGVSPSDYEGRG